MNISETDDSAAVTEKKNTAVVPVENPRPDETGEYNWIGRHREVKALSKKMEKIDVVFIGDSITHYFGGNPKAKYIRGGEVWEKYFGKYNSINMRFGCDGPQHVLWRLENGAIDEISPRLVVLMIGTNNIGRNTPEEINDGIKEICKKLKEKLSGSKILVIGILPRSHKPDKNREAVEKTNKMISNLSKEENIYFMNIGDRFIEKDGTINSEMMSDYLHPTAKGYAVFAEAVHPRIEKLL